MHVSGKMQVDLLPRHDLSAASAGGSPLHAENRPQGGLTQGGGRPFAQAAQRVRQADGGQGFAFPGRGRGHGRHHDQPAALLRIIGILGRDLGFVFPERFQGVLGDSQLRRDLLDGFQGVGSSDLPVVHYPS